MAIGKTVFASLEPSFDMYSTNTARVCVCVGHKKSGRRFRLKTVFSMGVSAVANPVWCIDSFPSSQYSTP